MRKMERSIFGKMPARVRRSQHEVTDQTALPEEQKGDESFHRQGRNGRGFAPRSVKYVGRWARAAPDGAEILAVPHHHPSCGITLPAWMKT